MAPAAQRGYFIVYNTFTAIKVLIFFKSRKNVRYNIIYRLA